MKKKNIDKCEGEKRLREKVKQKNGKKGRIIKMGSDRR